jgi:hypothetical protein
MLQGIYFQLNTYCSLLDHPEIQKEERLLTKAFMNWQMAKPGQKVRTKAKMLQAKRKLIRTIEFHLGVESQEQLPQVRQKVDRSINYFMNSLIRAEQRMAGFAVTNQASREYLKTLADIHLGLFLPYAYSQLGSIIMPDKPFAIKDTYQRIGELLVKHYIATIDRRFPLGVAGVSKTIVHISGIIGRWQIHHARLKASTMQDFQPLLDVFSST